MAGNLTSKQRRFVAEYLVDFNATQAAIRAGYSEKTAAVIACENLTKPNVAAEITRLGQKAAGKLEITREWVLERLHAIASADIADYLSVTTERAEKLGIHPITGEVVMLPAGWEQYVQVIDTAKIPAEKRRVIAGIKQGTNGIEVKLHDAVRALELLGKATGAFDSGANAPIQSNNLFEAIVGSAGEDVSTDDIPELEQAPEAGDDVVEPPEV